MNFIEIRRGTQVLILARNGVLPQHARAASDRQRLPGMLARLGQDKTAMASVRANWFNVFPSVVNIVQMSDAQVAKYVTDAIAAKRAEAALLRDASVPLSSAEVDQMRLAFANARVQRGQIIVAQHGALPPAARNFTNPAHVVQLLGAMQDGEEGAVILDRQAGRLTKFGLGALRGRPLRTGIVAKINQRVLDAAFIPPGPAATAAGSHPSAGTSVASMGAGDKVAAALQRSLPHLSGEVQAAVAEMVTPTNLVIMAGIFVAVALANTNPVTGAAVDSILLGVAWFAAGLTGVYALGDFIDATVSAIKAKSETELDEAGKTYAKALVGMGSALIQAIMARFLTKKGGTVEEGAGRAAAGDAAAAKKAPPPAPKSPPPPAPKPPPKPPTVSENPAQLPISSKSKIEAAMAAKMADQPVPPPSEYLSKEYIDHHLADFKDGSVYKVISGAPRDGPFGGDKLFVSPKSEMDAALLKSGGDPRKLESILSMEPGYLGDSPYLLEFPNPKNLGMATGNEANAWKGFWEPGGFTQGGMKEAVIDGRIDPKDFIATPIKKGP